MTISTWTAAITMKQVFEIKSKDAYTLRFITPNPDGKEAEMGTIEYTRSN